MRLGAPSTTIDLHAARKKLRGLPPRRLDSDWLAVDDAGHVALFAGNDRGPIPEAADVARVSEALDALVRAASARRGAGNVPEGYRRAADDDVREPVFDTPVTTFGAPAHEMPAVGYPLLVVGTAPALREMAVAWSGREGLAREGCAFLFPSLDDARYQALHSTDGSADTSSRSSLCLGCRVLDDPSDPRPRAPEVLAAAGLYVYAHVGEAPTDPYRRVAGPSVAAGLVDLEPIVQLVASRVKLALSFENEEWLLPQDYLPCTP